MAKIFSDIHASLARPPHNIHQCICQPQLEGDLLSSFILLRMSAIYNLEPQPTASCILQTTSGDIQLELWAQQTPLSCRNFLQHCLDGYYNGTIFHRLVPGFILQGGDPTGTGSGGESIYDGGAFNEPREENGIWPEEERKGKNAGPYGVGFKDEFHSRLKFNRRGLLGMANEGPDTNGSQFFITLGATPELQGKNTLFGRVAGDTIYNVAKMGEAEVDGDRPLYSVKVTGVEVLVNPFKDMVPRIRTAAPVTKPKETVKTKKRKGGKQLLSFQGDDAEAEEAAPVLKKTKFDTRIVTDAAEDPPARKTPGEKPDKKSAKFTKKPVSIESSPEPNAPPKNLPNRSAAKVERRSPSPSPSPPPQVERVTSLLEQTNAQIASLKASMRRPDIAPPSQETRKKSALEEMIPPTSIRGRKRRPGGTASKPEDDKQALEILRAFKQKLEAAGGDKMQGVSTTAAVPPPGTNTTNTTNNTNGAADTTTDADEEAALCDLHFISNCQSCQSWDKHLPLDGDHPNRTGRAGRDQEGQDNDDDDDNDDARAWMSHTLSFTADKLGKDLSYRKKAEEDLVVIDPREKAKTLKEEKRAAGRESRPGGSGRAWDREPQWERGKEMASGSGSGSGSGPRKRGRL